MSEASTPESPPPGSLAEKLDRLFRAIRPAPGREYTLEQVASALRERGGPTISVSYLWQLRVGRKDNPTKRHLEALADFFDVSPAYFFDDAHADRVDAQLELLTAMRNTAVHDVMLRAADLNPDALRMVADVVRHARRLQGLPDTLPEAPPEPAGDQTTGRAQGREAHEPRTRLPEAQAPGEAPDLVEGADGAGAR